MSPGRKGIIPVPVEMRILTRNNWYIDYLYMDVCVRFPEYVRIYIYITLQPFVQECPLDIGCMSA